MKVFSHPTRKHAHLHLPIANTLSEAHLVCPSGEHMPLEVQAHDPNHYMLRWQPELPAGLYQLKLRSQSGEFLTHSMRI